MASGGSARNGGYCGGISRRAVGSTRVAFWWVHSEAEHRAERDDEVELDKKGSFEVNRAGPNSNAGEWPTTAWQE